MKRLTGTAVLTIVCLILVIPVLIYEFPFLAGAHSSYTVMSGSMSPSLYPGDLVIVKDEAPVDINIGDIVTIKSGEFVYTHRVFEKLEGDKFVLKGDANEGPDPSFVEASQIIGRVILVFPFNHLYTKYGFALALLAPALLIIGNQVRHIHHFTKKKNRRETMRWRRKKQSTIESNTLLLILIISVSTTRIIAPSIISGSSSYFSDIEWSTGYFSAGIWEIEASVDIEPDRLNLKSQGPPITAYIETEYDEINIDVGTVELDNVIPAVGGEVQEDGRLMVKFDREQVIDYLIEFEYEDGEEVTLTVSGEFLDGVTFIGEDTIVVNSKVKKNEG